MSKKKVMETTLIEADEKGNIKFDGSEFYPVEELVKKAGQKKKKTTKKSKSKKR